MDNSQKMWEQELYNEMIYKRPKDWFHTFEGDSAIVGLSFVDNREAHDFNMVVTERLDKRRSRIEERRKMSQTNTHDMMANNSHPSLLQNPSEPGQLGPAPIIVHEVSLADRKKENERDRKIHNQDESKFWTLRNKKSSKAKPKLTKYDIGAPTADSFIHVTGVRPSDQGFQMVDNTQHVDPRLRKFLEVAGLGGKKYMHLWKKILLFTRA